MSLVDRGSFANANQIADRGSKQTAFRYDYATMTTGMPHLAAIASRLSDE